MRSRHPLDTTPLRRGAAVTFLVAVVIALLSMPSSSAPGDPTPGDSDLPGVADVKTNGSIAQARGTVASTQGTVVRRSKMYITISPKTPIWGVFYNNMYNTPVDDPVSFTGGLCSRGRPCVPDPFEQPSCADPSDINTQWRAGYYKYRLYPVSPLPGGGVDVGFVAKVPVNLVAFGSIPARATLLLRAPRINGKVQPLKIHLWDVKAGLGCDPAPSPGHFHALVEGSIEVSITDLSVDGVPVKLSSSCRTVKPAEVQVWGESSNGYSPLRGGNLGGYAGLHPGSQGPLESPYYLEDRGRTLPASTGITVPPFTGCKAGSEDISPLVTAMASGPNNPIRIRQGTVIVPPDGIDLNNLAKCNGGECPLPAPDEPAQPPLPDGDR